MEKIMSKVEPETVISCIGRGKELSEQTARVAPFSKDEDSLQAIGVAVPKGEHFRAHKHLPQERQTKGTQESLVIIEGTMKGRLFDLDDSLIWEGELGPGDIIVNYAGGHEFFVTSDARFYEFKNGPYNGADKDKVYFDP